MVTHQPGCPLESVYWLRHAVAAAGVLTHDQPDPLADRKSAEALTDALAHFTELSDWSTVTLKDVADQATFMNQERFAAMCECGSFGDS